MYSEDPERRSHGGHSRPSSNIPGAGPSATHSHSSRSHGSASRRHTFPAAPAPPVHERSTHRQNSDPTGSKRTPSSPFLMAYSRFTPLAAHSADDPTLRPISHLLNWLKSFAKSHAAGQALGDSFFLKIVYLGLATVEDGLKAFQVRGGRQELMQLLRKPKGLGCKLSFYGDAEASRAVFQQMTGTWTIDRIVDQPLTASIPPGDRAAANTTDGVFFRIHTVLDRRLPKPTPIEVLEVKVVTLDTQRDIYSTAATNICIVGPAKTGPTEPGTGGSGRTPRPLNPFAPGGQ